MKVEEIVALGKMTLPLSGKRPAQQWVKKGHATIGTEQEWKSDPDCTGIALKLGNVLVIDIDNKRLKHKTDIDAVSSRALEILGVESTFIVKSGSGNGSCHLYFLLPDSKVPNRQKLRSELSDPLFENIDILSNNQYVALPGSKHVQTDNFYTVYDNSKIHSLEDKWLMEPFVFQETNFKPYEGEIPLSKYLYDTKSRHKSIMKDAIFMVAVTSNEIPLEQLAKALQERVENSPCGSKTLLWDKKSRFDFYISTSLKAKSYYKASLSMEMIEQWGASMHFLSQIISPASIVLAVQLLKEFEEEGSHVMYRSYRQIADKILSVSTIQRCKNELVSAGFIKWERNDILNDVYSRWTLMHPAERTYGRKTFIDLTHPAFTDRRSGGLGVQAGFISDIAIKTKTFTLKELTEETKKEWGASKNTKNIITLMRKEGILVQNSLGLWRFDNDALDAFGANSEIKEFQHNKIQSHQQEREDYHHYIDKYKTNIEAATNLLNSKSTFYPLRYKEAKIILNKHNIERKFFKSSWLRHKETFSKS